MPRYSTWTSLAFEVAKAKGARFEGAVPNGAEDVISVAAAVWREDPDTYRAMTESQARDVLEREIQVR